MSSPSNKRMNQEEIVEDSPRLRSVSMMSAPPNQVLRHGPSMGFVRPKSYSPLVSVEPVSKTQALPTSWTAPSPPAMPLYYQLERTHVRVAEKPAVITKRLSHCLREESMHAIYHEDETCVDVDTCDNVSFSVRLWQSEDANVLIEVQRTSGCCFLFHQASRAVLCAALGEASDTNKLRVFALPECIPQETEAERQACLKDSLKICSSLLQNERVDAHLMALESLVKLSTCCRSRTFAARSILSCGDFLQTLVSLIQSSTLSTSDHESNRTDTEQEHLALMHRHAMTVLANCLAALQEDNETKEKIESEVTTDSMLMALIEQVARCDKEPHEACQAMRCLQELVRLQKDCKQRALALGLDGYADKASRYGDHRHLQLHSETQKLLQHLND